MAKQVDIFGKKEIKEGTLNNGKKVKPKKHEENLQLQVSQYIMLQYPDAIFNSDIASGMRLPIWIAAKAKRMRSEKGQPDVTVFEPRMRDEAFTDPHCKFIHYHGLCMELKKDRSVVYKQDGNLLAGKHLREQADMLERLRKKGYWADFVCGFDHAKKVIDWYFSLEK